MIKLLIFGTGESAEKVFLNTRKDKAEIIGYLDNNPKRQGSYFKGTKIYAPYEHSSLDYDYIIIATLKYDIITRQLMDLGIDKNKIVPYFKFDKNHYDTYRQFLYADSMNCDELAFKFERMEKYIKNMEYELADRINRQLIQLPKIKTIDETIDEITERHLSISRYGDGEFDQIAGRREGYQEPDRRLSERLKEVLQKPIENHAVGLPDIYGDLSYLGDKYADYFRNVLIKHRSEHYEYIDMSRTYLNAFISRLYSEMKDKSPSTGWFTKTKRIWDKRNVVIVEGSETRFGVGNDLLDNASLIERILCPSEGAFDKYNDILNLCLSVNKDKLFLLALGPTATVLAYDLAKAGYQAIDIGHFDIEYEWYLRNVEENKVIIDGKYTNEVVGGNVVAAVNDEKYINEIIFKL